MQVVRPISKLVIFSDGCSSQYKSMLPFLHLTELASSNPWVHLQRCYFGSNHGKSLCDAAGGTAKRCATRAVLSGTKIIQRAETFIAHCSEQMKLSRKAGMCSHKLRSFHEYFAEDLDRSKSSGDLQTVHGTQKIHGMPVWGEGMLRVRQLLLLWEVHTGHTMCQPLPWLLPRRPAVASSWWPPAKEEEIMQLL